MTPTITMIPCQMGKFDFTGEGDIAMIVMMHKNKKLKHGGSVFGRECLWRER